MWMVTRCKDGVVVIRSTSTEPFKVAGRTKPTTIEEFTRARFSGLRSPFGVADPMKPGLTISGVTQGSIDFVAPVSVAGDTFFSADYLSATVIAPNVRLDDPTERAVKDIEVFLLMRRLGEWFQVGAQPGPDNARDRVIQRLESLEAQFNVALARSTCEEDIQRFLAANPFVMARQGTVQAKVKLGKDYVTDFVIEDLLAPDRTHLLVEIEDPTRRLFHQGSTQVHSDLTKALHQVQQWRTWLKDHAHYFRRTYVAFRTAKFQVILGRSADLDDERRQALQELNARDVDIEVITFDDLLSSLTALRQRLRTLDQQGPAGEPGGGSSAT